MTLYKLAGYLHLIGGVGLFVALGLEWAMIVRDRLEQLRNALLLASVHGRAGILLGILALMKFKPDVVGSVLTIVVALLLGVVSALPMLLRQPHSAELA